MRYRAVRLTVLVLCVAGALAASASPFEVVARGFVARDFERLPSADSNRLADHEISRFESISFFDFAPVHHLNSISAPISVGSHQAAGTIQINGSAFLVSTSTARFGRRTFVWDPTGGTHPGSETPIPEPGAALLFAVGAVLVGLRLRRSR